MIRFRCPKCDSKMEVDDAFGGRAARCSTCGQDLKVPRTDESRSATPATPPPPGAAVVKIDGESVEILPPIDSLAIFGLVMACLSLVTLVLFLLIPMGRQSWTLGMVLGVVIALLGTLIAFSSYNSIRISRGRKRGMMHAKIALAGSGVLFLVCAIVAIVGFAQMHWKAPCEKNLTHIYAALRAYADRHDGSLPNGETEKLEVLVQQRYLDSYEWLICPAHDAPSGTATYDLTPNININVPYFPQDLMIVCDKPPYDAHEDGCVRVLLLNGTVEKIPLAKWGTYQKKENDRWNKALNKARNPQAAQSQPTDSGAAP